LGSEIAAARLAAGLDLDAVAQDTRLRRTVLELIERDDFSLCGGDVYARGHLRSIARCLGVDPAPWLEEFDREHAAPAEDPLAALERDDVQPAPRGPNWTAAMAAALAVVVGLGVWTAVAGGDAPTAPSPAPVAQGSPDPAPSERVEDGRPPTSPSSPRGVDPEEGAVASVDEVTATVRAVGDRSWIAIAAADGRTLFEGVLEDGDRRSFADADGLRLVVGNAGAVVLTVNGQDQGRAGRPGEVVRLSIGPDDGGGS
jgi:cytoskeletal protein RodZ